MKTTCVKWTLSIAMMVISTILSSGQVIPASGGDASGSSGSLSFTVGQLVYRQYDDSEGSILQGIQQPFEIYVLTRSEGIIAQAIKVFPNPTSNTLHLKFPGFSFGNHFLSVYDFTGNLLMSEAISASEILIQMSNFPSGAYLLVVYDKQSVVKTFRILRN